MIPPRDRVGQIRAYTEWLSKRFGTTVSGMWMPERVWEQSLTSDLADAGMRYTLLDDFHFKNAGLTEEQLHGYYITEDDGEAAVRLPGQRAAALLDSVPRAAGDDRLSPRRLPSSSRARWSSSATTAKSSAAGPARKSTSTTNGWLRRFFDALVANRDWLQRRDADRSARASAAARQDLPSRGQLPRNDRVGAARRAAGRIRRICGTTGARRPLAANRAVRARRLLAELQGEVSRNQRNVRPHADGQPAAA